MKHTAIIMCAAALAIATGSCSLFQKSATISGAQGTTTAQEPATQKPGSSSTPTGSKATDTSSAQAGGPKDATKAQPATTHDLSGEWLMVQVGANTLDRDEDMPYIIFDKSGRFYANDGCNTVNGNWSLGADDRFTFKALMMTRRYCPDQDIQHTIATVLNEGTPVQATFSEVGTESYIDLAGSSGKTVVRLRRANIDFLNGEWEIVAVNGTSINQEAPADIFFDIAERKVHGNTGCNYFNGEIYLDHRQSNAIDLSKMGVTRMACPYTEQETALMVALEETTTARSGGKNTAMLLSADGRELVMLRRPEPQAD